MSPWLLSLLAIVCFSGLVFAADSPDARLAGVSKIFIGEMGKSDHAERFRFVLEDLLVEKGFSVVTDEALADATISGVFTLTIESEDEIARASIRLKLPSGERIWGGEFRPSFSMRGSSDMTKRVAMTVTNRLREDKKKAARK